MRESSDTDDSVAARRPSLGRGDSVPSEPAAVSGKAAPAAAAQVNAAMEALVRECPQQYLWGYARYKVPREDAAP